MVVQVEFDQMLRAQVVLQVLPVLLGLQERVRGLRQRGRGMRGAPEGGRRGPGPAKRFGAVSVGYNCCSAWQSGKGGAGLGGGLDLWGRGGGGVRAAFTKKGPECWSAVEMQLKCG